MVWPERLFWKSTEAEAWGLSYLCENDIFSSLLLLNIHTSQVLKQDGTVGRTQWKQSRSVWAAYHWQFITNRDCRWAMLWKSDTWNSVVMDLHLSTVIKIACLQNIIHFAPWKHGFIKMTNQINNFNMLSTCLVLGLLVLSQIPARNWLDFWKEGIKDCGVS